jgi:signal peptidase
MTDTVGRHRMPAAPSSARVVAGATRLGRIATSLLMTVATLLLLAMTVGPRVLHYRTATMLTGSMSPTIRPGDVVIDTPIAASAVKIGDVITYQIPVDDHRVESHRVVWVGRDTTGAVLVRTQGDANPVEDPWTARFDTEQVWRVRHVIPFAGQVIRELRRPSVHLILTLLIPLTLVGGLLKAIWTPRPKPSAGEDDGDGGAAADGVAELEDATVRGDDALAAR